MPRHLKLYYYILMLIGPLFIGSLHAQAPCTHTIESSVTFVTQEGMEDFLDQIGCTVDTIRGDLFLGPNLTSLEPLQGLRHIGGGVFFQLGYQMETLEGLDSLETIDDWFLMKAIGISNLDNLSSLRSVGANEDEISSEGLSFNIDLHNAFVDTIKFEKLESINSARSTLRVYGAPALPFLSNLDHIGNLTIFQSDSIKRLPHLNNLKSIDDLKIYQCQNLESIVFQSLDSIESIQINRCPKLDSVVFEKPLTFSTTDPFIEMDRCEKLSHFKADFRLLPDVELSMALYNFPLLRDLPDFSKIAFRTAMLGNIGVTGTLDFSGPRPASRINRRAIEPDFFSFQTLPNIDTLIIPELKAGYLSVGRSNQLTSVLGGGFTPRPGGAGFILCPVLQEIEFLKYLENIDITSGIQFIDLETYTFEEGDLDLLQTAGCISFQDLPGIQPGAFPQLLSLDTAYHINIERVAFDTLQLLGPELEFLRSFHFKAIPEDPFPSYLSINAVLDSIGLGLFDETGDHCADWYAPGVEIDFNNSNVSVNGFNNVTKTGRIGYTNAGELTPDPHENFLSNVTEIGELYYRNHNRETIFSVGQVDELTPIDTSASRFRIMNGRLTINTSPRLLQAEFLCPIVESRTITEYDLEGNSWPFDDRRTLEYYCDQISSSSAEVGRLQKVLVYPTAIHAGGNLSITHDGAREGGYHYQIVNNLGVCFQNGTLINQSSQVTLSNALIAGTYFVQVYDPRKRLSSITPILVH